MSYLAQPNPFPGTLNMVEPRLCVVIPVLLMQPGELCCYLYQTQKWGVIYISVLGVSYLNLFLRTPIKYTNCSEGSVCFWFHSISIISKADHLNYIQPYQKWLQRNSSYGCNVRRIYCIVHHAGKTLKMIYISKTYLNYFIYIFSCEIMHNIM